MNRKMPFSHPSHKAKTSEEEVRHHLQPKIAISDLVQETIIILTDSDQKEPVNNNYIDYDMKEPVIIAEGW